MDTMKRLRIDPNVRIKRNLTYVGFEDVLRGPLPREGEQVEVMEQESGLYGHGTVESIDSAAQLIYLSVDWASLVLTPRVVASGGVTLSAPATESGQVKASWKGKGLADNNTHGGVPTSPSRSSSTYSDNLAVAL